MIELTVLAPALAAIVTAGGASLLTYLTMRRAKSGQINSTEADQLWQESGSIRRELRGEIQNLQKLIGELRLENAELKGEMLSLRLENADLKREVLELRSENAHLTERVERLKQENVELRTKQQQQDTRIEEATT